MDLIPFSLTSYCLENYFIRITSGSKIIYWIIILMVTAGILILPFVYVDVSVQARGYFQSDIEKQLVTAPFHGKVIFTSIRNGDKVLKGDTLFIIDSEAIRAKQAALVQEISENDGSITDLEKLAVMDSTAFRHRHGKLVTKKYQAEFENVKNQHTIQFQKYRKKKTDHERNDLLFRQELIPETEFENSLFGLRSETENLNQILIYQKSVWQNDLAQRRNEAVKLLAEFEQCTEELTNRIGLAPISGEILQSTDVQAGSIVIQGQKIAEISPDGDLVATCFVKPADIGLINENQRVRIQVDAFNYNEWGMLNGTILDISDDMIVENGSTAYFRVRCTPDRKYLSLKNGHKGYLKKGMSLNARIVVVRRSLFNLLFDKADKWFNPYSYTKK